MSTDDVVPVRNWGRVRKTHTHPVMRGGVAFRHNRDAAPVLIPSHTLCTWGNPSDYRPNRRKTLVVGLVHTYV